MTQVSAVIALSHHAASRCQQRGVCGATLSALLDHYDRSVPVGGGNTAVSLSRRGAARLRTGGYAPAGLDRIANLAAVLSPDGQVVTVLHATDRRYRRVWN